MTSSGKLVAACKREKEWVRNKRKADIYFRHTIEKSPLFGAKCGKRGIVNKMFKEMFLKIMVPPPSLLTYIHWTGQYSIYVGQLHYRIISILADILKETCI